MKGIKLKELFISTIEIDILEMAKFINFRSGIDITIILEILKIETEFLKEKGVIR